ncbi:hypothetical protein CCMA1212_004203 [Trichoderma ghanense]|uniref:Uncharacterized protein n=1 Tax=Trichoderma ghanense TaxID=65468 RepID=A0ABY2H633_9HYPO
MTKKRRTSSSFKKISALLLAAAGGMLCMALEADSPVALRPLIGPRQPSAKGGVLQRVQPFIHLEEIGKLKGSFQWPEGSDAERDKIAAAR